MCVHTRCDQRGQTRRPLEAPPPRTDHARPLLRCICPLMCTTRPAPRTQRGAQVNRQDPNGCTALHFAVRQGHYHVRASADDARGRPRARSETARRGSAGAGKDARFQSRLTVTQRLPVYVTYRSVYVTYTQRPPYKQVPAQVPVRTMDALVSTRQYSQDIGVTSGPMKSCV